MSLVTRITRSLRMVSRPLVLSSLFLAAAPAPAAAHKSPGLVVENFSDDPADGVGERPASGYKKSLFTARGAAARFTHERGTAERFRGDKKGSLRADHDSALPTGRYYTTFPGGAAFTDDDDFVFGAALTIRREGFAADPFGFAQIAFALFDSRRTGDERTGTVDNYAVDTYSSLEWNYFPNVSPWFGGPFVSPSVFGDPIGDAFANFAFGSSVATLRPGVPYLVELRYTAAERALRVTVHELPFGKGSKHKREATLVAEATTTVDLAGVSGFRVDSLGVAAFRDGFNDFAPSGRSLRAVVDYDLLFSGAATDKHLGDLLNKLRGKQ